MEKKVWELLDSPQLFCLQPGSLQLFSLHTFIAEDSQTE